MDTTDTTQLRPSKLWPLKMAWRDSRGSRGLLLLFMLSIVFGMGSIVAILSLRQNLSKIIEDEARSLLGSDLILSTRSEPTYDLERFIKRLPGEKTEEIRMRSMASFPSNNSSRFVQVRSIEGTYPFYGEMETSPAKPSSEESVFVESDYKQDGSLLPPAIVEESLMLQNKLSPGDIVQIGEQEFRIKAALIRVAGESEVTGFFAPRIYIPLEILPQTGLISEGSIVRYRTYFAFPEGITEAIETELDEAKIGLFVDAGVRKETVDDRRRSVERILGNLFDFLNLIGFTALFLGGIGIAGAVQVFVKSKLNTIAVLRCLGTSARSAFTIYLIQISIFGLIGAFAGIIIGVATQFALPKLLESFLPFNVNVTLEPTAILSGLLFGWLSATLFSLLPLLEIRKTSPLKAIRASFETKNSNLKDPLFWCVCLAIVVLLTAFIALNSRQILYSISFVGGLLVAMALLALVGFLLRAFLKRFIPANSPYSLRIAMGNLYRPNNRTILMVVTMGMGVLLLNSLWLTHDALLEQVAIDDTSSAPNVIVLDVQEDQLDSLQSMLEEKGNPVVNSLPVVTMRVEKIKGIPLRDWRAMEDSPVDGWVYTWEFRNTYRDHVLDNAEVIAGEFTSEYSGQEPYPISISENVLDDFGVQNGDTITWNVQGISIETVITSVRKIRWEAGSQNFNIVFPLGTIEAAPTVYALTLFSKDRLETANLQADLLNSFPNISLIDLSLVFDTVNEILSRVSFVIQFMAAFTIATGLIVLAGTVLSSRFERIQESRLFHILGAPKGFLQMVPSLEFIVLGLLASLTGWLLSLAASWAVLRFVFSLKLQIEMMTVLYVTVPIVVTTWFIGFLTTPRSSR